MMYCEAELCLAASIFGRGGILSENHKGGKVTVHSAKNTDKFDSTVGRYANRADEMNLGVAAALRSNIYGGVPRATSLTTMVSGGPDADDCVYVEFKVDGSPSALSNSFIGAFQVPSSWPTFPRAKVVGTYRAAAAAATTRSASSARSPGSRVTSSSSSHAGDDDSSDEDDGDGSSDARAMVEPSGQHRMRAHGEQQSRRQQRQHNVSV